MNKQKHTKPGKHDPAIILFSYVPLLMGKAGCIYDFQKDKQTIDSLLSRLDQMPSGRAECCLWTLCDDNRPMPVLVMEQAQAIADHLRAWADNEPSKWFQIHLKEKAGKYGLVIFPQLERSVGRFKFARLLEGGEPLTNPNLQFICRPLHFVSSSWTAYSSIKDRIGTSMGLGLVDAARMDYANPFAFDPTTIIDLGEFEVGHNQTHGMDKYLDTLIDDATEAPTHPSQLNPAAHERLNG